MNPVPIIVLQAYHPVSRPLELELEGVSRVMALWERAFIFLQRHVPQPNSPVHAQSFRTLLRRCGGPPHLMLEGVNLPFAVLPWYWPLALSFPTESADDFFTRQGGAGNLRGSKREFVALDFKESRLNLICAGEDLVR